MQKLPMRMWDKIELHTQIQPADAPAWLIATHGIGEHSGRHGYLRDLCRGRCNLLQYDLRGHGLSLGRPAYVKNFWNYMQDLQTVLHHLKEHQNMRRFALFGHSMGALIVAGFAQKMAKANFYPEKIFLSSPPIGLPGVMGKLVGRLPFPAVKQLANLPFGLYLDGLVDQNRLSHDPKVKESYGRDSRNISALHTRLLLGMAKASREVFSQPIDPRCPGFVTVGGSDTIIDVPALLNYFTHVEGKFALKVFPGGFHELHNEIEKLKTPYLQFLEDSLF